jgi:HK97 family phage major capsid protein
MSEFIKTQQEIRANLTHQIRDVIDGAEADKRGLDTAEIEKINAIENDIRRASEAIEVAQRNEERSLEASEAARGFVPVTESRSDADIFRAMARGEVRSHTFEKRAALVNSVNTVPVEFFDQVMMIARLVGPYLDVTDVIQRSSGSDLRIPTMTAYSTAAEYAAGSAIADSEPTFSSILLSPKKQAFIVQIANELLTDAGFDIQSVIAEQAGNAIGTRANAYIHAIVGTAAGSGVTAGTTNAFTADDLINLAYSLDGAARRLPGVGYMANTSTVGFIRRLKDGDGRYIYDPQVGGPDRVLGYEIFENPALQSIATTTKPVFFGHWPSVKVTTTGLEVATSTDAYFANDVTAYRFVYRLDAGLTHAAHVKSLEMA